MSTSDKATSRQREYIVSLYNEAHGTDHVALCDCEDLDLSWLAATKLSKAKASKMIADLKP